METAATEGTKAACADSQYREVGRLEEGAAGEKWAAQEQQAAQEQRMLWGQFLSPSELEMGWRICYNM